MRYLGGEISMRAIKEKRGASSATLPTKSTEQAHISNAPTPQKRAPMSDSSHLDREMEFEMLLTEQVGITLP